MILYQLLTGRLPFTGSLPQVLAAIGTSLTSAAAEIPSGSRSAAGGNLPAGHGPESSRPVRIGRGFGSGSGSPPDFPFPTAYFAAGHPCDPGTGGMLLHRPGMHVAVSSPISRWETAAAAAGVAAALAGAPTPPVAKFGQPGWGVRRSTCFKPASTPTRRHAACRIDRLSIVGPSRAAWRGPAT